MVVLDAVGEKQVAAFLGGFPPRRDGAPGWLAVAEFGELFVCLVEDVALLLEGHVHRVFVRVAVQPDFVARVPDCGAVFGEGFEGMTRDEPCGLDVVFFEELEEALCANCARP